MRLYAGQDLTEIMESWRTEVRTNKVIFLASIPFVRNLAAYRNGHDNDTYKLLTSCLHASHADDGKMCTTGLITFSEICDAFEREWNVAGSGWPFGTGDEYLTALHGEAQRLKRENNGVVLQRLQSRVVLAMSLRLMLEECLWHEVCDHGDEGRAIVRINEEHNQTSVLIDMVKRYSVFESGCKKQVLEQAGLVVNEHVHLNAFMYEPLIDTGVERLLKLHKDVREWYSQCK